MGKVYLTAAGAESYENLTMKAYKTISDSDVIVYDDLLDEVILSYARNDAEMLYVGKRSGKDYLKQEQINQLLFELANKYDKVCRLKGGDPFVFGRGGEEAIYLKERGVECEVISGVTSAIALPAKYGIPVTHRGISRGFHVVTAHTKEGLNIELELAAKSNDTLIVLMGLGYLKQICEKCLSAGKDKETPVAVCGSTVIRGNLENICDLSMNMSTPVVIVIGDVAALEVCDELSYDKKSSVGIVGTDKFIDNVKHELSDKYYGIALKQAKLILKVGASDIESELKNNYEALIFLSANGVEMFFELMKGYDFSNYSFAAIGPKTKQSIEAYGYSVEIMPKEHYSKELAKELVSNGIKKALLLSSEKDNELMSDVKNNSMLEVKQLQLYQLAWSKTRQIKVDYIVFGSSSGVENYFNNGGLKPLKKAVAIGKVTENALKKYVDNYLVSEDTLAEEIVKTIQESE